MKRIINYLDNHDTCNSDIPIGCDVWIDKKDCEVRVDIKTARARSTVIWGQVSDCSNQPTESVLLKLLRYTGSCNSELEEVCYTYTDCNGNYQFDLPCNCEGNYRVVVCKCASERQSCRHENEEKPCFVKEHGECRKQNNICYY